MLTTTQIAAAVGVDRTTIQHHCREGHLPGAVKAGRDWFIPQTFADPAVYRATVGRPGRKRRAAK
jgi:predicted site-specific integrase-resolvase